MSCGTRKADPSLRPAPAKLRRERSFGRLEAKAPTSLREITQGRREDDARRIVRKSAGLGSLRRICSGQAGRHALLGHGVVAASGPWLGALLLRFLLLLATRGTNPFCRWCVIRCGGDRLAGAMWRGFVRRSARLRKFPRLLGRRRSPGCRFRGLLCRRFPQRCFAC